MSPGIIRKAQPTIGQVHTNAPLTDIAVAYMQSDDAYIADKVFPTVPVAHKSDLYYTWTKDDFFRDEAQKRADGAESAGSGLNLSTASYNADVWALHKDIGDQARANADPAVDLEIATTKALMQKLLIRRDRIFATNYMTSGKWGTDITGVASAPGGGQVYQWSDGVNSDPFNDIEVGQTTVLQNTGQEANVLVLGYATYQALRKHPLIIDRVKYTMQADARKITPQLLAGAFDVERVVVAKATYNTASEKATGSYSFIVGKTALLCYAAPEPGLMVPSAGYIFGWDGLEGNNSEGISAWSEPVPNRGRPGSTTRCEAEMAFDMHLVGADLGYMFNSITG